MKTDVKRFARRMLLLRAWERERIPSLTPLISVDVLLLAASRDGVDGPSSIKLFHLALNYSQDRIREVIRKLVEDGWLRIEHYDGDGRVKCVRPTEKLITMLAEYECNVREMFEEG